jgi:hypothetical protein
MVGPGLDGAKQLTAIENGGRSAAAKRDAIVTEKLYRISPELKAVGAIATDKRAFSLRGDIPKGRTSIRSEDERIVLGSRR